MVTTKHCLVAAVTVIHALAGCSPSGTQIAADPAPAATTAIQTQSLQPVGRMSRQQFIQYVQILLDSNGASLTADGRMGPKTVAALHQFQKEHNLKVTGQPDQATLK